MVTFHLLFDILRLLEILGEVEICDPIMYKICIKHISTYIDANLRCGVTSKYPITGICQNDLIMHPYNGNIH